MKKLIFDIGANIGRTAEFYLERSEKTICFEPNPDLIELLKNKFQSHLGNKIVIDGRGLSDKEEVKSFKISNADTISTFSDFWINQSRFTGQYVWDRSVDVQTTTMDKIIEEYGIPDFVKIDVEGYELEVLSGLTKLLDNTVFSFEWSEEQYDEMNAIASLVKSLGYVQFAFTYGDPCSFGDELEWSKWEDLEFHNIIVKERKHLMGMIYFKK